VILSSSHADLKFVVDNFVPIIVELIKDKVTEVRVTSLKHLIEL
jgi:hypothetical protein